MIKRYLGMSGDLRTNAWELTCTACGKKFKPQTVIQIADEHYEELYKDIAKEDREQILDHCADWLWSKLMDWCKKHGDAPAKHNDLFALVEELRNKKNEDPE